MLASKPHRQMLHRMPLTGTRARCYRARPAGDEELKDSIDEDSFGQPESRESKACSCL